MLDEAVRDDLLEAPVEREQRVTALELFFDLVFVFAITQVTGFLYHDPTWTRVAESPSESAGRGSPSTPA